MSDCTATRQVAPGIKFVCTRPRGHTGQHIARGIGGVILRRWTTK